MADAHKNFAYSTVATAPSPASSGTSLVVAASDGAKFPTVPFNATIWPVSAQPTTANAEIVRVTAISTDTLTITRTQESTSARTVLVGDQIAATVTVKTLTDVENVQRSARSSNTILAAADRGQIIAATAAYTQTLTAAATLGAGWWCYIKNDTSNGTSVLVVDPNGSETIDGLTTITMYSGETRLLSCDGSNFQSVLIDGGFAKFTPTGGNFIVPSGIEICDVVCIGSGGQGGGGASSVTTNKSGGGGGGGGAVSQAIIRASDLGSAGSTITVTVGAGGSGGGGGGVSGAGANGTDGANGAQTTFGTLLKAGGGGGGKGGTVAASQGGAGGSVVASAVDVTAGAPSSATPIGPQAATASAAGGNGNNSDWGGANGGGGSLGGSVRTGGSAINAGPGGGAGGSVSAGNLGLAAGAGGTTQSYSTGGGASAGSNGASPTKGSDGVFVGPYCGSGGGGGGGGTNNAAGATNPGKDGGVGGIGAGGGGGGCSASTTTSSAGGNGGVGGAGECRVWYS